jgi:hypothetical protein
MEAWSFERRTLSDIVVSAPPMTVSVGRPVSFEYEKVSPAEKGRCVKTVTLLIGTGMVRATEAVRSVCDGVQVGDLVQTIFDASRSLQFRN